MLRMMRCHCRIEIHKYNFLSLYLYWIIIININAIFYSHYLDRENVLNHCEQICLLQTIPVSIFTQEGFRKKI
jgi:hypothetical protein